MPAASKGNEPGSLQFVAISDFSPGIYSDWYGEGGPQPAPLGAAQQTGTVGCLAGRGGGLIPGPRRVNRILETLIEADGVSKYPNISGATDNHVHITAFRCASPVGDRTGFGGGNQRGTFRDFPDSLIFSFEWYYNNGGSNYTHNQQFRTYKCWKLTSANPSLGSVSTYDIGAKSETGNASEPFLFGHAGIELSRSDKTNPVVPGFPFAALANTSNRDITVGKAIAFPDFDSPTTDSSETMAGVSAFTYGLIAHQNRILSLLISVNFGFGADSELPFDGIQASSDNDYSTVGVQYVGFVNENPGLIGSWASINASELVIVKQQRGGYVIRGSLATPTIIRIPGLPSTQDAGNIGTVTPNGFFVYGTKHGVYGYQGGDTGVLLSPQLDGWFWKPDGGDASTEADRHIFTKGSFTSIQQFVFAPNNWIYDTTAKSWWRLTDPDDQPYMWYDTSGNGNVIAVSAYVDATHQTLADWYDITEGQSEYTWRSQPLPVTQNRIVGVREIDLVASGHGQILVTLTGMSGTTPRTETFTVDSDIPVAMEIQTSLDGHDIYIDIESAATDTDDPAPRIYRIALGYNEGITARA